MRVRCSAALLLIALIGGAVSSSLAQPQGQPVISGQVVDDSSGSPLARAHVFVSGSMIGTATDDDGRFRLTDVPAGALRLVVTRVGYAPERHDLTLPSDTSITLTARLSPTVVPAGRVTVRADRDEEWEERLNRFQRLFVGPTEAADRCDLQNPEVLRFETSWWGKFEADARRPLVFENRALGYRVTYHLTEFEQRGDVVRWDGEPVFEPLAPSDSVEARRWADRRRQAFEGSLRHFLLTLLHDRLSEENFQIYRLPRARTARSLPRADRVPTSRDEILELKSDELHELDVRGALAVVYRGAAESESFLDWADLDRSARDKQVSYIQLNQHPIHVDDHGSIAEPYGAKLHGYFAFTQRIAHKLPREYRPPNSNLNAPVP